MRTALVVGGIGGIGEALARRLAATGTHVVVTTRSADRFASAANTERVTPVVADPFDPASLAAAVLTAAPEGRLDAFAYAVGSIPMKPMHRVTADDMLDAYRINVVGALLTVQRAAEALKAAKGAAVLFSSVAARQGFPNHAVIGAAKAAVEGLVVSLAADLAPDVRINAVAPSLTETPLAAGLTGNARMAEAIAALHPLPRLGRADDAAAAAAFLLSPEAGWITGQVLGVDGGRASLRTGRGA